MRDSISNTLLSMAIILVDLVTDQTKRSRNAEGYSRKFKKVRFAGIRCWKVRLSRRIYGNASRQEQNTRLRKLAKIYEQCSAG